MLSFLLWLLIGIGTTIATLMLASYAVWFYENQKVLDLAKHIKQKNQTSILDKTLAKRGFTAFDLNSSIAKSKQIAQEMIGATKKSFDNLTKQVNPRIVSLSRFFADSMTATKKSMENLGQGVQSLFKQQQSKSVSIQAHDTASAHNKEETQPETEYKKDVETLIANKEQPAVATINLATKTEKESQTLFEKTEKRILEMLKDSDMQNLDIWMELGIHYKKWGQIEKAQEVFALVMKHSSGLTKEKAKNELIGLS